MAEGVDDALRGEDARRRGEVLADLRVAQMITFVMMPFGKTSSGRKLRCAMPCCQA
jgi:hypothetical protein